MPRTSQHRDETLLALTAPISPLDLLKQTRDRRARLAIVSAAKQVALCERDYLGAVMLRNIEARWRKRYYL